MKSEEILDRYLWAFNSSPTYTNFKKLGGRIPTNYLANSSDCYRKYLDDLGYDVPPKAVYRVYDLNRGKNLVFIGSTGEISFHFKLSPNTIKNAACRGSVMKTRYILEKIDLEKELENVLNPNLFRMDIYDY